MTDRASAFAQYDVAWLSPAALGTAVQWLMMLVAAAAVAIVGYRLYRKSSVAL